MRADLSVVVSVDRILAKLDAKKRVCTNPDALEEIARAGAEIFEAEAKILCPVLDGDLRDSIHQEVIEKSSTRVIVAVGPDEPYALRTEFGHSKPDSRGKPVHQAPQPYMRPAYDTKKEEARQANVDKAREVFGLTA